MKRVSFESLCGIPSTHHHPQIDSISLIGSLAVARVSMGFVSGKTHSLSIVASISLPHPLNLMCPHSETWGPPYDPHSYASAWEAEDNEINNALVALDAPSSREELLQLIEVS